MSISAATYHFQQSEKEFQATVVEMAEKLGWLCVHFPAMLANPSGFPDLILIKGRRTIFAELKRERDFRIGPKQQEWIDSLDAIGAEIYIWRPRYWESIENILRGEG